MTKNVSKYMNGSKVGLSSHTNVSFRLQTSPKSEGSSNMTLRSRSCIVVGRVRVHTLSTAGHRSSDVVFWPVEICFEVIEVLSWIHGLVMGGFEEPVEPCS